MEFLLILPIAFMLFVLSLWFDQIVVYADRLRGRPRIWIKSCSGDTWQANIFTDPWGVEYAYRYPGTRTGQVTLNGDGTGYYCGNVIWKRV